jgi:hypothetical protein
MNTPYMRDEQRTKVLKLVSTLVFLASVGVAARALFYMSKVPAEAAALTFGRPTVAGCVLFISLAGLSTTWIGSRQLGIGTLIGVVVTQALLFAANWTLFKIVKHIVTGVSHGGPGWF